MRANAWAGVHTSDSRVPSPHYVAYLVSNIPSRLAERVSEFADEVFVEIVVQVKAISWL